MTNPHSDNLDLELVAKDPKQLERLVSNFKTYVLAFESSPLPFALFDKDHRIRRWNKAYEKLHGWLFDNHREEIESGKFRYEDFVRLSAPKELEGEALEEYVHDRL